MNFTDFTLNILFLFTSFILNYILIRSILPFLRNNLLDKPNKRSSHIIPKPTGGGLSFFLITLIFLFFTDGNLWLFFLPLGIVSFLDDRLQVSAKFRYSVQFLTSLFIVSSFANYTITSNLLLNSLYFLFLVFLGTSLINFFNFIDGVDGLLAGLSLVIFTSLAFYSSSFTTPLIGGLIAFLLFNWMPSKLFMGDIGSTFLGAYFFYFVISEQSPLSSLSILFLALPILADCNECILRRFFSGQNIFLPHKLHFYQRLAQGQLSHAQVSILYVLISVFIGVTFLYLNLLSLSMVSLTLILIGFLWGGQYAKKFKQIKSQK